MLTCRGRVAGAEASRLLNIREGALPVVEESALAPGPRASQPPGSSGSSSMARSAAAKARARCSAEVPSPAID